MRVYRKKYKVSESFAASLERGDTWRVRQAGKIAEEWLVVDVRRDFFLAEITEYFPRDGVPRSHT